MTMKRMRELVRLSCEMSVRKWKYMPSLLNCEMSGALPRSPRVY